MKNIILFAVSAILAIHGYSQIKALSNTDRDNLIKTHNTITMAAHQSPQTLDWNMFVKAHYADDAILMPPNAPIAEGQSAIVSTFKSWPPLTKFQTNDLEVVCSGNLAYIRGTYEISMNSNGKEVNDNGKYIEIWSKDVQGEWKCIRDIFNSNTPVTQ